MIRNTLLVVAVLAGAASCGRIADSRFNPLNWFGRDRPAVVTQVAVVDPRPLVADVVSVRVDRTPEGAVLTAVGLPGRQGYWDAALVPVAADTGVLAFQFRLMPPPGPTRVSTPPSREVTAGRFLSPVDLRGIREVRVMGARTARSVAR